MNICERIFFFPYFIALKRPNEVMWLFCNWKCLFKAIPVQTFIALSPCEGLVLCKVLHMSKLTKENQLRSKEKEEQCWNTVINTWKVNFSRCPIIYISKYTNIYGIWLKSLETDYQPQTWKSVMQLYTTLDVLPDVMIKMDTTF